MARGRMLDAAVSDSESMARLYALVEQRMGPPHGAHAVIVATWLLAHLDRDGRVNGSPRWIMCRVVPLLPIDQEAIRGYLRVMAELGTATWYEAGGGSYLAFPNFHRYQHGLRREREPASKIPDPAQGREIVCRGAAATDSPLFQPKDDAALPPEWKGIEGNGISSPARAPDPPTTYTGAYFEQDFYRVVERPPGAPHDAVEASRLLAAHALRTGAAPQALADQLLKAYVTMLDDWRTRGFHGKASGLHFVNEFSRILDWHEGKRPGPRDAPTGRPIERPRALPPEYTPPAPVRRADPELVKNAVRKVRGE